MTFLYHFYTYLWHYITAKNTNGFGVHSPFLFEFTQFVIYEQHPYYCFSNIEKCREQLLNNHQKIFVKDFGTNASRTQKISNIARKSLKTKQYGQLLFRIATNLQAKNILELGTSLGITTCYLAAANNQAQCITLEGSPNIAKIAQENFDKLNYKNIRLIQGNINETLPLLLKEKPHFDIIFFDANHTYEATLNYFEMCNKYATEHTIFIFDDIHHSKEMNKAWKMIQQHKSITATIDLFEMGITFFNKNLQKKYYKMRF